MKIFFPLLNTIGLFKGIGEGGLDEALNCLGAEVKQVGKNEFILRAGEKPTQVGVVLTGILHIVREDFDGNRSLIAALTAGHVFAEALCCAGVAESPVTVLADTEASVLLMPIARILHTCTNACVHHALLIENMLGLIAAKNLMLQDRMEILGIKSVRGKVLRFFEPYIAGHGRAFTIPFNREELADYLCVERSALSHELARMKRDGMIDYKKNNFVINKP